MKKIIFAAGFFLLMLSSCTSETTEIYELAKQSDRVQVVFNSKPEAYLDIDSKKQIRKFDDYISQETTPVYYCNYDGYILFFTENGTVRMDFNIQEDCQHIVYTYGGITETKKLTPEGLSYLRSVKPA